MARSRLGRDGARRVRS
eukprot:gene25858-biopygen17857